MPVKLAQNLDNMMSNRQLSASELSRRINIPSDTIKKMRTGKNTNPTIATLKPIANYFGITVSQLIGEEPITSANCGEEDYHNNQTKYASIPIIAWQDTVLWVETKYPVKKYCYVSLATLKNNAYALELQNSSYQLFPSDSVIIVDPQSDYLHGDYVLVHKAGQTVPSIKKVINDEGVYYLQSIIVGLNNITSLAHYNVLGVIIGYTKWFK